MTGSSSVREPFADLLKAQLDDGAPAVGLFINEPKMVELAAHMGFDWCMLDQMFTNNDWQKTETLIRTANSAGITPIVRVHSYPWTGYDPHVVANVARAIGIGADYVMVSYSGVQEIEDALPLTHADHQKESHIFPYDDLLPYGDGETSDGHSGIQIIPHVESTGAFESLESVMDNADVDYCFIALNDAMQELTGEERPDWDDPRVWEFVDEVVELGRKTDTVVGANPSFHGAGTDFTYSLDVLEDRVVELHDRGIEMVMAQSAPMIFQLAGSRLLQNFSERIDSRD
ncbi:MAG: hypothetical protein ABEJ82_07010 [Haloplanus sp.]